MNKIKSFIIVFVVLIILTLLLSIKLPFLESLRIVFGSIFVLFIPGYVMSFIFFKQIEIIERIALSFALSIAVVPLVMFYLNLIGLKINLINSIIAISSIILISLAIISIQHRKNRHSKAI
ncbi:MAG: DUF1616 domain-containing protein [Nanoarchaeota archaeon]